MTRPSIGLVQMPAGIQADPDGLQVLHAAGFERLGVFPLNIELFRTAERFDMILDPTFNFSRNTIDWLKVNVEHSSSLGYLSTIDEPSQSTLPPNSQAYRDYIDLIEYAHQQLPTIKTLTTISAFALFDPSNRWRTEAAPYLDPVKSIGSDYFPYFWQQNRSVGWHGFLASILKANSSGKDTIWYMEMGPIGQSLGQPQRPIPDRVPAWFIVEAASQCRMAGINVMYGLWFPNQIGDAPGVTLGDEQWREVVVAMDQLTHPPSDINADGKVDFIDYQTAYGAYNFDLARRIRTQIEIHTIYFPVIRR